MGKKNIVYLSSFLFWLFGIIILIFGIDYCRRVSNNTFTTKKDREVVEISLKKENPKVELIAWWDIMLSRWIWWWAKREGYWRVFSWDNYNPLKEFECYRKWKCVLFFNLESMFSERDNDNAQWGMTFRANTWNVQYLLDLKRNNKLLLSLANNHTNNAGGNWVSLTREVLEENNIWFCWAWNSVEEAEEILEIYENWIHLCFQAFSYEWNSWKYWWVPLAWNPLTFEKGQEALSKMNDLWCEVKILSTHRWAEYRFHPAQKRRDLAYQLIDEWADIILGWHSHIPWEYEEYKWKPIIYSFWNFLFDQDWWKTANEWGFDYIYDSSLKRRTVPTYILSLASFTIEKTEEWIQISRPVFKMASVWKWLYSPIDDETFQALREELNL